VEIGDTLPGGFIDFHGVSTPRFLIVLSGQLEVGLGDGSKHILSKGDIVLADDVTGRGHTSRMIGTEAVRILTVRLPKDSALVPKTESCPDGMPADQCVAARLGKQVEARK
jgi:quercetin dioxygenase-like cupin family protein